MAAYASIAPELVLLLGVAWALFADRLPGGDRGAAYVGALVAVFAGALAAMSGNAAQGELFGGILVFDATVRFARVGIAAVTALWLLWTAGRGTGRIREAVALALLATMGCMLMTEARELVTLVLAVELATMPAYVLIGYRRQRVHGLEGALKYFLLSVMTTLIMLYGLSFLYGLTGSTRYAGLDMTGTGSLGLLAVLLAVVGLLAKLSAAPFHYWAPDAYAGAEPWTVAFVSTVPKVAGAVALVRLVSALAPTAPQIGPVLIVASVASMLLGNLAALTQSDVRRMMAYSGVAHSGYLLLGASALSAPGYGAATFYAFAYAIPSLGVMLLAAEEGPAIDDFNGLAARRPGVAWGLVAMLISLVGIPPLVGFFGKLYLFSAALAAGSWPWVLVAIVMSVVSAGYYLRLVRAAYFVSGAGTRLERSFAGGAAIALAALLPLVLGIGASTLLTLLGQPLR